jgi:glycerophosphoryl diester phosphodiesterase
MKLSWEGEFDVPEEMLDFEEKRQALNDPDGRFMVWSHRGDTARYPQNSIEAIISACMMGVDVCEVDVRVSKDRIPVLVHDATLTKTTNFSDMAGKTVNGMTLPTSAYVSDWTLAELRCLRLKDSDGTVTDYLIPTLEEAVIVAKGRMFLYCDKLKLEYDSTNRVFTRNDVAGIAFPIFAKHEAWDTMMYIGDVGVSYGYYCLNDLKTKYPESAPYYIAQLTTSTDEKWTANVGKLEELGMAMIARFSGWEDVVADVAAIDTFIGQYSTNFNAIKDRIRLHADCYNYETAEAFKKLLDYGINGAMVNDPLTACQLVAKKYFYK